jgi:RNA polymerase II subunit A small phosphatase-like protein
MSQPRRNLLILDIDETLVHATREPWSVRYDFRAGNYYIFRRPHLDEFLAFCFERFDVAVWTSSARSYAGIVVPEIFGEPERLRFVWSRERCTRKFFPEEKDFEYVKDLKELRKKGYDLRQIIVVDNTPQKLNRNYGNLVRIDDFEGEQTDKELKRLIPYLQELAAVENIRSIEKRGWKLRYSPD